jgi:uncharacterized protein
MIIRSDAAWAELDGCTHKAQCAGMNPHQLTSPAATMLPALPQALNQTELLRLDAFLHSPACGRDAMGLSHAHGFLTAVASGPEHLEPGEWLRLVFDEPVFADGAQAEDMLGLAMRLYQDIEASLGRPGGFRPVLDFLPNAAGGPTVDASAWCQGYRSGMTLCAEQWAIHGGEPLRSLLATIHTLARHPGHALGALNRQLCDLLPFVVEAIYRYWRAEETA